MGTPEEVDRIIEIEKWYDDIRKTNPIDKIIMILREALRGARGTDEIYEFSRILSNVLVEANREDEAISIINKAIGVFADDVRFPVMKATIYLSFLKDYNAALEAINFASRRSYETGFFRREVLGVKARILLAAGAAEGISSILEEIMALQMSPEIPDIGCERDFVDRAPQGIIPEELLARYNAFCPPKNA